MGKYLDRCKELRASTGRYYSCAQAVFIPFAEDHGIDHDTAYHMVTHFDYGYCKYIGICGAVAAGILVLGLFNCHSDITEAYMKRLKLQHGDCLDCKILQDRWKAQNNVSGFADMTPHYDAMCFACVALIEELLGMGDDETLIGGLETWQYASSSSIHGDILFGVKIQKYRWINTGKYALVKDPLYGTIRKFPVYHVKIKGELYEFAAAEVSNSVFCYFTRIEPGV